MPSRDRIDTLLPEIERLLALGWSAAKIGRTVGCSPQTVGAILAQTRAPRTTPKSADELARDRLVPQGGEIGRCRTCGRRCRLPCMACALRDPDPLPPPRTYRITSKPSRELLRSVFTGVLLLCGTLAAAAEHALYLPLRNVEVIDGDTIRADIALGYDVLLHRQTIRADNYDAWESSRARRTVEITDEEIVAGKQAKVDLESLIQSGSRVWLIPCSDREPHGRRLGHWIVETADGEIDVAAWMRKRNHCRPGG